MIQIILLIVGIVYAVRRPKLKALELTQFSDVPADKFQEWKDLELRSIDIFLWATWGLLIISIPVGLAVGGGIPRWGDRLSDSLICPIPCPACLLRNLRKQGR